MNGIEVEAWGFKHQFNRIMHILDAEDKAYISIGFLVGILYALFTLIGINESVNTSVMMTEEEALKNTKKKYLGRVIVIIVILVLFWFLDFGNPVAFIIGALGLKFSAFIQPISDRLMKKITHRR